ncbi:MAG: hypothetical protein IPL52_03725 [Flavobacteriales bacterium]|nr:hypothetical protein [Flavobacteriales bacterium]
MLIRTLAALACCSSVIAISSAQERRDPHQVDYIKDIRSLPDPVWQAELRERAPWRTFLAAHPLWTVEFNEGTAKPRRAFGPPIEVAGSTAEEKATNFIATELARFGVSADELVHQVTAPAKTSPTCISINPMPTFRCCSAAPWSSWMLKDASSLSAPMCMVPSPPTWSLY